MEKFTEKRCPQTPKPPVHNLVVYRGHSYVQYPYQNASSNKNSIKTQTEQRETRETRDTLARSLLTGKQLYIHEHQIQAAYIIIIQSSKCLTKMTDRDQQNSLKKTITTNKHSILSPIY